MTDPLLLLQNGTYYLLGSQGKNLANVPEVYGTVLTKWSQVVDALPYLPPWALGGGTSAPDIHQFGDHYVLYFSSWLKNVYPRTECIGDATATTLGGPYDPAPTPFICQRLNGGSIDPRTFVDRNGTPTMIWKSDENSDVNGTSHTHIWSQPLSADGLHLLGQPTQIFAPDEAWQGRIVEAPDLFELHGTYYLFYSGNWFNQDDYAIGVARCSGPRGPCADTSTTPFLASNAQGSGPGEPSLFESPKGGMWLVYTPFHSNIPYFGPARPAVMARLGFGLQGPYLANNLAPG
jgi:beta-xylosidase